MSMSSSHIEHASPCLFVISSSLFFRSTCQRFCQGRNAAVAATEILNPEKIYPGNQQLQQTKFAKFWAFFDLILLSKNLHWSRKYTGLEVQGVSSKHRHNNPRRISMIYPTLWSFSWHVPRLLSGDARRSWRMLSWCWILCYWRMSHLDRFSQP